MYPQVNGCEPGKCKDPKQSAWVNDYCPVCHLKWAFNGCVPGECGMRVCPTCRTPVTPGLGLVGAEPAAPTDSVPFVYDGEMHEINTAHASVDAGGKVTLSPNAAPVDSLPFVASRPELGENERRDREFARLRSEEAERDRVAAVAGFPGPWRWEDGLIGHAGRFPAGVLRDANGRYILDRGDGDGQGRPPPELSPRVRALTEAAPELRSGVAALLGIIHDVVANAWPIRLPLPDDAGPICANLRALLDRIDRAK